MQRKSLFHLITLLLALWERIKNRVFKLARRLPWVQRMIAKELIRLRRDIHEDLHKMDTRREFIKMLPEAPMPFVALLYVLRH